MKNIGITLPKSGIYIQDAAIFGLKATENSPKAAGNIRIITIYAHGF